MEAGDTVYVVSLRPNDYRTPNPAVVKKVGRKYFELETYRAYRFRLDNMETDNQGNSSYRVYRSIKEYDDEAEQYRIFNKLKQYFNESNWRDISLSALEKIYYSLDL